MQTFMLVTAKHCIVAFLEKQDFSALPRHIIAFNKL